MPNAALYAVAAAGASSRYDRDCIKNPDEQYCDKIMICDDNKQNCYTMLDCAHLEERKAADKHVFEWGLILIISVGILALAKFFLKVAK